MSRQGRKILGGAMLVFGVLIVALSVYLLIWGDGSWKWFIGIPDGLFAAITGLAIIAYARGANKTSEDADLDGAEAERKRGVFAALTTPFRNARRRRKEKKQAETVPAPATVTAVPSISLNKRDRRNRDPLTAADSPHPLISRRLDRYGHSYYGTDPRGDGTLVGAQVGLLAHDRDVNVDGHAA